MTKQELKAERDYLDERLAKFEDLARKMINDWPDFIAIREELTHLLKHEETK